MIKIQIRSFTWRLVKGLIGVAAAETVIGGEVIIISNIKNKRNGVWD